GLSGQIGQWAEAKLLKRLGLFGLALPPVFRAAWKFWMLLCLFDKTQDHNPHLRFFRSLGRSHGDRIARKIELMMGCISVIAKSSRSSSTMIVVTVSKA